MGAPLMRSESRHKSGRVIILLRGSWGRLLLILSLVGGFGGCETGVQAAKTTTRVLTISHTKKTAYHGRHGIIYGRPNLTRARYQMKRFTKTTWRGTKRAWIKRNGAKVLIVYVQAGPKRGWIYRHNLLTGPVPQSERRAAKILATNRAQKYWAAYRQFSAKGHPLTQRGSTFIAQSVYHRAKLTLKQYNQCRWGIYDYYQNAINHGWVSQKQGYHAERLALKHLLRGDYAR